MASAPEKTWIKFFSDAGLPSGICASYALTFAQNRIQMNMLLDLDKEYLREMGIHCMGDVIAILRHAKHVHEEIARDRVLGITAVPASVARPVQQNKIESSVHKRSLNNYVDNHVRISSPVDKNNIKERLGEFRKIATKRKITTVPTETKMDMEEIIPNKMKRPIVSPITVANVTAKKVFMKEKVTPTVDRKLSDVFARLGDAINDDGESEDNSVNPKKEVQNVFSRLGGKAASIPSKTIINNDAVLKYEGVLKPVPKKLIIKSNGSIRTLSNNMPSSGTMQADKIQLERKKSVKFSPHVDCKLISKSHINSKFLPKVVTNHINPPPVRNVKKVVVSTPKVDIKMRLGGNSAQSQRTSEKFGVFGRLGLVNKRRVA